MLGTLHRLNTNHSVLSFPLFFIARLVAESLQPSKMLFDKESPNLYREPLISMQLTQLSLERILALPTLPASVSEGLTSFQQECIKQVVEVQKAIQEWKSSGAGQDRSPWGVSDRKPIFEILWKLASGSTLMKSITTTNNKGEASTVDTLDIIHDPSKVHPVIIEASQRHARRLFLIQ